MEYYNPRPREVALEQLKAYILEHDLQPGDCLPPEREMCRSWGINRTTLRSAIARLEASGQLVAVQGSGTRIAQKLRISPEKFYSFFEAATACSFQPETKLLSFASVSCDENLSRIFHRSPGEIFYKVSRLRLLDEVPVVADAAYIPADLAPGLSEHDLVNRSLFQILQTDYLQNAEHGRLKISLTQVSDEEARLLALPVDTPAFQIVTLASTSDGIPVEYSRATVRADKIELVSSMHWERGTEDLS